MFRNFWERYITRSGDTGILKVVAPFIAFRGLVLAHPLWYPTLSHDVRRKIKSLITTVLECDAFDPAMVNAYCAA